ncbi:hypothetical protein CR513_39171, partial [Mucuna pruriens]
MSKSTLVTNHINNHNTLFAQLTTCLSFDDVVGAILEEESKQKNKEDKLGILKEVEALMMTRGRPMECGSSGNQNHVRKNLKCYNCGMREHLKKDCWHNKKNEGKNFEPPTSQGCVAITLDDGLILYKEATINSKGGKQLHDGWIMDSSATWLMTPHRDWFCTYEPIFEGFVIMP